MTDMTVTPNAALRQRLLDAATDIFVANGYHATRVADIVQAVGVAQGTFYLYFANKEAIFTELVTQFLAHVLQDTLAAYQPTTITSVADVQRVVQTFLRLVLERCHQQRQLVLLVREAGTIGPTFRAHLHATDDVIVASLMAYAQQWSEMGLVRPVTSFTGWLILGMLERAAWYVATATDTIDLDLLAEELMQFELHGVLLPP